MIKNVIERARELEIPVFYIQDLDVGKNDPEQHKIHPSLLPLPGENVINKKATNAFFSTTLQSKLNEMDIEHIVIIGVKTEFCVDTTARAATTLGFDVTLIENGHSTTDNKILSAEQIISHHNCNLHGLDNINHFIFVRKSGENIFEHKHLEYK